MELRHIRYFLAVAGEESFTRAAARLGIGQPPLSMQIRDLESEVGAKLFDRTPHGVRLTEAGKAFREAVRAIPERAEGAVRAAKRAARGETGKLNLGFTGTAAINPIVPASIRAFRRAFPEVELKLVEANSMSLLSGLVDGRLDVAFLRPSDSDPAVLREIYLVSEPLIIALPATHPAARTRGGIDLTQIRDVPLILAPRAVGTSLHDAVLKAYADAGFEPLLGPPAPQIASMLSLVAAEMGVSLVPEYIRQLKVEGVVYRAIRPKAPHVGLAVASHEDRASRIVANFEEIARAAASQLTG